eukprot:TRINITY_DN2417_c0_g1_i1.p1 TRINITY_DN2417_c0_g1~~TRINITY_DN2417_c0_g1_i1.p1  ORF type:complete len:267 (+),score=55.17 TRINITY_DN2417_c0_g1_i1:363-1163(+)
MSVNNPMEEDDELAAPGYAYEQHTLKFTSANQTQLEIQLHCLERLSLFDAVGLLDGNDCTGLKVWPGARALCRYLAAHPDIVVGKRVLELGAGAGLVGLLAGKLNASKVKITDSSEDSLALLRKNAEQNFPGEDRVSVENLEWHHRTSQRETFDLVVASDVIYFHELVEPLFRTVHEHLSVASTTTSIEMQERQFLLCFSSKGKELNGYVLEVASKLGLHATEIKEITTLREKPSSARSHLTSSNDRGGDDDGDDDEQLLAYSFSL